MFLTLTRLMTTRIVMEEIPQEVKVEMKTKKMSRMEELRIIGLPLHS